MKRTIRCSLAATLRTDSRTRTCVYGNASSSSSSYAAASSSDGGHKWTEWRGLQVAAEYRCSPHDADNYSFSQSVVPRIVANTGGTICGPFSGRVAAGVEPVLPRIRNRSRCTKTVATAGSLARGHGPMALRRLAVTIWHANSDRATTSVHPPCQT